MIPSRQTDSIIAIQGVRIKVRLPATSDGNLRTWLVGRTISEEKESFLRISRRLRRVTLSESEKFDMGTFLDSASLRPK